MEGNTSEHFPCCAAVFHLHYYFLEEPFLIHEQPIHSPIMSQPTAMQLLPRNSMPNVRQVSACMSLCRTLVLTSYAYSIISISCTFLSSTTLIFSRPLMAAGAGSCNTTCSFPAAESGVTHRTPSARSRLRITARAAAKISDAKLQGKLNWQLPPPFLGF